MVGMVFIILITGEKLIEEGLPYYLETDNEVVVFEQTDEMMNRFIAIMYTILLMVELKIS